MTPTMSGEPAIGALRSAAMHRQVPSATFEDGGAPATAVHTGPAHALAAELEALAEREGAAQVVARLAAEGGPPASGWSHFWAGWAAQSSDTALSALHWRLGEAQFQREQDALGCLLAACGLVQWVVFDNAAFHGFEARAALVREQALLPPERPLLRLFQVAARLALARIAPLQAPASVQADIEHAFVALGAPLPAAARLRAAAAALGVLGQHLDQARIEDFIVAARGVARAPGVGDFDRALWHLSLAEAQFPRSMTLELDDDLAAAEAAADRAGAATDAPAGTAAVGATALRARAAMLRAANALAAGALPAAQSALGDAHALLAPQHTRDWGFFHFLQSRLALLQGDSAAAGAHIRIALVKQEEAEVPPAQATMFTMQQAFVHVAGGRYAEAQAALQQAGELSRGGMDAPCWSQKHFVGALAAARAGAPDELRQELASGWQHALRIDWRLFFRALPDVAAEVCALSLETQVEPAQALRTIRARALRCPDVGVVGWPWPIALRTLGGFALLRDGEPLRPAPRKKAPQRLIDLLKVLVALGARQVDAGRIAATLWPHAEGDAERDALRVALFRLRRLLGDEAVLVHEGRVTLDERLVWIDTWALEAVMSRIETLAGPPGAAASGPASRDVLGMAASRGEAVRRMSQLLALYRGPFLGDSGETPPWALPQRDRLRARFLRTVEALGGAFERGGEPSLALDLYRAALEQDNLAENLYQRLMALHLAHGEPAQALLAYRRCREMLSIVLGLQPSPQTEALRARIAG